MPQKPDVYATVSKDKALAVLPSREVVSTAAKRIIMIRHMEAGHNKDRWLVGQADTPLTPQGIEQAERMRVLLQDENIALIVSSDMERAFHTAEITRGQRRNLPIHETTLARERHYGELEQLKLTPAEFFGSEYAKNLQELLKQEVNPKIAVIELVPGWETDPKLAERMKMVIDTIFELLLPGQTALFVSHAHAIRALVEQAYNMELNGSGSIPHESGFVLEASGNTRKIVDTFGGVEFREHEDDGEDSFSKMAKKYIRRG